MIKKNWHRLLFILSILFIVLLVSYVWVTQPILRVTPLHRDLQRPATRESIQSHIRFLLSLTPPRKYSAELSMKQAADYIFKNFEAAGCKAQFQTFEVEERSYQNVICHLGPSEGSQFVVGAHYDVVMGTQGADDNASGVAALLELAFALKPYESEFKKGIELVAYALEEPPFFGTDQMGSYIHAQSLRQKNIPVEWMLALECLGYESETQEYPLHFPEFPLSFIDYNA